MLGECTHFGIEFKQKIKAYKNLFSCEFRDKICVFSHHCSTEKTQIIFSQPSISNSKANSNILLWLMLSRWWKNALGAVFKFSFFLILALLFSSVSQNFITNLLSLTSTQFYTLNSS